MPSSYRKALEHGRRRARLLFNVSFYPLLILYLAFAVPLVGNFGWLVTHDAIGADCPSGNAARATQNPP